MCPACHTTFMCPACHTTFMCPACPTTFMCPACNNALACKTFSISVRFILDVYKFKILPSTTDLNKGFMTLYSVYTNSFQGCFNNSLSRQKNLTRQNYLVNGRQGNYSPYNGAVSETLGNNSFKKNYKCLKIRHERLEENKLK
ncbi:unnamed protein product [Lymnaea stagnalis]|uniref:Uncharacterized protein n=1 Tax=Lymnaea stagnalis TaxID=6523 RepID=A0AAV2HGC8_LYMST